MIDLHSHILPGLDDGAQDLGTALEMMEAMDRSGIAPKRVQTVHGMPGRAPKFLLMDGVRGGGPGLHWLPPLVLRNEDGTFSDEWRRIYRA